MAQIKYTQTSPYQGVVVTTWTGVNADDDCQPLDRCENKTISLQADGDFRSGSVDILGSLNDKFHKIAGFRAVGLDQLNVFTRFLKPAVRGDAQGITITAIMHKGF